MDFEVLVRYMLPGTLALAPVFLSLLYSGEQTDKVSALGGLLVALAIPVGYLIHQAWLAAFETKGGYISARRPNLRYLSKKYAEAIGRAPSLLAVYYACEAWMYSVTAPGQLHHARRVWAFYHGHMAGVSAVLVGLVLLGVEQATGLLPTAPAIGSGLPYFMLGILLFARSLHLRRHVDEWELMMVVEALDTLGGKHEPSLLDRVTDLIRPYADLGKHRRRTSIAN